MKVGYIPFLNMMPFHRGFGPEPCEIGGTRFEFRRLSPHALGQEADSGAIDAGCLSLVDCFLLADRFEPIGDFGIGVRGPAQSVLLFSNRPLNQLSGLCAVTDETATSIRLLKVLHEKRYGLLPMTYGRVASGGLYDGSTDGLLLIGDEALRARHDQIKGLPVVTDLGQEWLDWQKTPFTFARWMVRKDFDKYSKASINEGLSRSLELKSLSDDWPSAVHDLPLSPSDSQRYWAGFSYRLSAAHVQSIERFKELLEAPCLSA